MNTIKLYTNDTGRLPVFSRSGNQYIMVAYHSSNVILVAPFKARKNKHRIAAYTSIMQRLKDRGLTTHPKVLDNESSQEYKATIKDKWSVDFQLVPPVFIKEMQQNNKSVLSRHIYWPFCMEWLQNPPNYYGTSSS